MKTIVINNREALIQGQMQPTGKDSNNVPILGPVVTLLPGLNLVDTGLLASLRKNPGYEQRFATVIQRSLAPEQNPEKVGKVELELMLVEHKGGKDGKSEMRPLEVEDDLPLAKLPEETCKVLVKATLTEGILRTWARQDARPAVRWEIEQQLSAIGAAPAGPAAVGR